MAFLETYTEEAGTAGLIVVVLGGVWAFIKKPFTKTTPTQLAQETIDAIKRPQAKDGPALTVSEFIRLRRALKADLEAELAEADIAEKEQLLARIAELESQIDNPEISLAEAQAPIRELEDLLDRSSNEIGGDRIAEARAALERGDYSVADDLFAEIESRQDMAVHEATRAAHGRGEIAEAEVRWKEAAGLYARAARLVPDFGNLHNAREFAWRSGQYDSARRLDEELLAVAREGGDQRNIATALNEHALTSDATGRYEEAEPLYREAVGVLEMALGAGTRTRRSRRKILTASSRHGRATRRALPMGTEPLREWFDRLTGGGVRLVA